MLELYKFFLLMEGDHDDGWLLLCYLNPTDTEDYWWYGSWPT